MGMEEEVQHDLYSVTQQTVLGYASVTGGVLSVLGCLWMAHKLIALRNTPDASAVNGSSHYHLLLGLTMTNMLFSLGLVVLGPWAMPAEATSFVGPTAIGNWESCAAAGFFVHFFVGSAYYWTSLAFYYVTLAFEVPTEAFSAYLEPVCHMVVVLSTLVLGPVFIYYRFYAPLYTLPGICWVANYPPECTSPDLEVECTRGEQDSFYYSSLLSKYGLLVNFCAIVLAAIIIMVWSNMKNTAKNNRNDLAPSTNNHTRSMNNVQQGLWYVAVYFVVYTPTMVISLATFYPEPTAGNRIVYFILALATKVLSSSGGFLNALVFLRHHSKR